MDPYSPSFFTIDFNKSSIPPKKQVFFPAIVEHTIPKSQGCSWFWAMGTSIDRDPSCWDIAEGCWTLEVNPHEPRKTPWDTTESMN